MSLAATLFLAIGPALPAQARPAAASAQEAKSFEGKITITAKLNYLLSLPADYGKSRKSWPLVLFLHGSGESGSDLAKVKVHGPPKLVEANGPFPFILVSPQSPGRGWNPDVVNALLDSIINQY
jgi:predicted peptidase